MSAFAVIAGLGVVASLIYYFLATLTALRFVRRSRQPAPALPKVAPRIAILKPLHGRRSGLIENLTSYLEADYPRSEYYFAVSSYEDPSIDAPVALRAQYQFKPITILVGESAIAVNRKVGKLIRMAERAERAEIFVLSDADIAVTRDHLRRVTGELCASEKTGVVTCLYRARPAGSFASRLEALCVNTDLAPQVMLAAALEPTRYALGATIAIKREALAAIGGFERLQDLLADDYYLGKLVSDAGYDVKLSNSIVTTICEEASFADFWNHQLRWARTYRTVRPASLTTIVVHGPLWALLFLLASGFSSPAVAAVLLVVAARILMARTMIRRVLDLPELSLDAWLVPIKDLLMTAIWFASLASNQVKWGGRRLRILPGGAMREIPN